MFADNYGLWEYETVHMFHCMIHNLDMCLGEGKLMVRTCQMKVTSHQHWWFCCIYSLMFCDLCCRAKADLDNHLSVSHEWSHFCDSLDHKKIIQAPFCGDGDCEDKIKKDSARYKIRKKDVYYAFAMLTWKYVPVLWPIQWCIQWWDHWSDRDTDWGWFTGY